MAQAISPAMRLRGRSSPTTSSHSRIPVSTISHRVPFIAIRPVPSCLPLSLVRCQTIRFPVFATFPAPVVLLLRMPSIPTGFIALLVTWLLQVRVVLAQDWDHYDGNQGWGNDPNNITMCGVSDFYNSTTLPYSCKLVRCLFRW